MRIYKTERGIVIEKDAVFYLLENQDWNTYINDDELLSKLTEDIKNAPQIDEIGTVYAPIDKQELWACGVTYLRSKIGRQEESKDAGDFYGRVYEADRPEVFFKSTAHRVSHPE